jgi:hypothetical protein
MPVNARRVLYGILLAVLLVPAFFATYCLGVFIIHYSLVGHVRAASKNCDPAKFPVLVLTPGAKPGEYRTKILYREELAGYLTAHPKHTFLVPRGQETRLNRALAESQHGKVRGFRVLYLEMFSVRELPDGHQRLRVTRPVNGRENIGYYTADAKGIKPILHTRYDALSSFRDSVLISFTANIVLWAIGILAYIRKRIRRARA